MENSENTAEDDLLWNKIYNGTFIIGHKHRSAGKQAVIDRLNYEDPLMFQIVSSGHFGPTVIRGNCLWYCNRVEPLRSVIVEYRLKASSDYIRDLKDFVIVVLGLPKHDVIDKIQKIIIPWYTEVRRIPLGKQWGVALQSFTKIILRF